MAASASTDVSLLCWSMACPVDSNLCFATGLDRCHYYTLLNKEMDPTQSSRPALSLTNIPGLHK